MQQLKITRLTVLFTIISSFTFLNGFSQTNITATVSQGGKVNYRVTKSVFDICISQDGKITDYGGGATGGITYDYNGRTSKIGSTSISYDYKGRIDDIGSTPIAYDYNGRVAKVGNYSITYDFKGRLGKIGELTVTYDYMGRVSKIGSASITYDYKGRVDKIDDSVGIIIFRPKMTK